MIRAGYFSQIVHLRLARVFQGFFVGNNASSANLVSSRCHVLKVTA